MGKMFIRAAISVSILGYLAACSGMHVKVGKLNVLEQDKEHLRDAANQLFIGESSAGRAAGDSPHLPQNPWLVQSGTNAMHANSYASELQDEWGPLGADLIVKNGDNKLVQRQLDLVAGKFGGFGGMCATITFDTNGNLVTVCVAGWHIRLLVLDPVSLVPLAKVELPPKRNLLMKLWKGQVMSDTSGGAYFVLAKGNEPIIPTYGSELRVYRINYPTDLSAPEFSCPEAYKISSHPSFTNLGEVDVTTASPDFENNLWFATREGIVGVIPADVRAETRTNTEPLSRAYKCQPVDLDDRTHIVQIAGPKDPTSSTDTTTYTCPAANGNTDDCNREQIQNSFVVGEDGLFVVSSRATYRLETTRDTSNLLRIQRTWSTPYAYSSRKAGMGTDGSGTTPSLAGTPDNGIVVIGDNADPKIQLNILDRKNGKTLCDPEELGLFLARESAVEDSVVALAYENDPNKFSIVVNNSYGVAAPNLIIRAGEIEADKNGELEMKPIPYVNGVDAIYRVGTGTGSDDEAIIKTLPKRAIGLLFDGTYKGAQFARGIWRIDVERDPATGVATCTEKWRNGESVGGVMKLSTKNNVIYAYTREFIFSDASEQAWYLTSMDFNTGYVLNRSLIGTGTSFYNIQGALNLCNGAAYLPLMSGLARARDHDPSVIPAGDPGRCPVRYPR